MIHKERRRHFFINRPLQLRYMFTVSLALFIVIFTALASLYFGIWGGVLDVFSDEKIQNDLVTASRMQEYEEARVPAVQREDGFSTLSFFRQAERLSQRQKEIFKELLNRTNRNLAGKLFLLLVLIGWGSVFLSHKIAGPLFRFQKILESIREGDLAIRCHLRKFDEAKPVAQSFNQTLEFLDATVSRMKKIALENGKNRDRLLPRLKEELSKFKTSSES